MKKSTQFRWLWLSLLLSALSITQLLPATASSGTGSMIGLITAADTGQRLPGVTVTVDGQTTLSNAQGIYRFDNVPEGEQVVTAALSGYQPAQKARTVIKDQLVWNSIALIPAETTPTPSPSGALTGLITHAETGERLANVQVSANGQTVLTNQNGVYVLAELPSGQWLVSAQLAGFLPAAKTGVVVAGTTRWNSFSLASVPTPTSPTATAALQTGTLTGIITNAQTGERLAGVTVSVNGQSLVTDENGFYLFSALPVGEHTVFAEHPDFQPAAKSGIVVANDTRWNSIALFPAQQPEPTSPPTPTDTSVPTPMDTPPPTGTTLPPTQTPSPTITPTPLPSPSPTATPTPTATPSPTPEFTGCPSTSEAAFDLIPIQNSSDPRPDFLHGDLNLAQRGYSPTNAALNLVNYAGGSDLNAPQLAGLFEPNRFPGIEAVYRVNHWNWACGEHGCRGNVITNWPVTLLGLRSTPGQPVYIPERGPQIFSGGLRAMVLYAEEQRLTLGYTRDDTVAAGYAVHIENICVDANLLALYRAQIDGDGFRATNLLPAVGNNQQIGLALETEIQVAIRDRGAFMDPRSRKDWWQGF